MYEVVQHTADVRIRIAAASIEELFADALRALMEVMGPVGGTQTSSVSLTIEAPDLTALLVDYLNDILLRCHIEGRAFDPESIVLQDHSVEVTLIATDIDGFGEDVKAVTYHEAEVRKSSDGTWSTTLVLDL